MDKVLAKLNKRNEKIQTNKVRNAKGDIERYQ
jgi:hypothetical protein